jgi:hypothetical protein
MDRASREPLLAVAVAGGRCAAEHGAPLVSDHERPGHGLAPETGLPPRGATALCRACPLLCTVLQAGLPRRVQKVVLQGVSHTISQCTPCHGSSSALLLGANSTPNTGFACAAGRGVAGDGHASMRAVRSGMRAAVTSFIFAVPALEERLSQLTGLHPVSNLAFPAPSGSRCHTPG